MMDATTAKLSSMHFHGWQLGLKTGLYYLRTKAAADAIKFTVDVDTIKPPGQAFRSIFARFSVIFDDFQSDFGARRVYGLEKREEIWLGLR